MWAIYLITRLDTILGLSWTTLAVALATIFTCALAYAFVKGNYDEEESRASLAKIMKSCIPFIVISALICIVTPTTKEAVVIYAGGKTIEYVEEHNEILETPDKVAKLANTYLDNLTEKLEKESSKETTK